MKVRQLMESGLFQPVCSKGDVEREITAVYCCDLLSIAMGRAPQGAAWVTVMANQNTLAVAALTEVACIILAEGMALDQNTAEKARAQNILVLSTKKPVFEAALAVYERLS